MIGKTQFGPIIFCSADNYSELCHRLRDLLHYDDQEAS
jgi:hypothetical protein